MANTIILKKSSVAGKVPVSGDLTFGEVALNYADGKIYYKNTATSIDFVGNGGTFTNTLKISNSTQSTSTVTGAFQVVGGTGIGGNLYVDGLVRIQNTTTNTTSDTGALQVAGGVGISGNIHVLGYGHFGLEPTINYANPLGVFTGNYNGYTQVGIQNISNGTSASADLVITTEDGTDTSNYIDLGINNSQFSDGAWTVSGPRDGYLYVNSNNLTIGVDTAGKTIKFHVGGNQAADVVAVFRDPLTSSTSPDTGAFTVTGGAGISSNLHVGGTIYGTVTTATLAVTADKWTTARTITLAGDLSGSVSIDGSTNVTLTATVAANSVSLGTDTTGLYVATAGVSGFGLSGTANTEGSAFTVTSNATSTNATNTLVFRDTSGNFSAGTITAALTGNVTGNLTGTATTATNADKWTTARTITLAGDLSGSVSIDGSAGATLTATIAADSVALGTDTTGIYVASGAVSGFGLSGSANTEGSTFTVTANSTSANTVSTIVYRDTSGNFSAGTITAALTGNVTGNLTGTATTATNLAGGAQGGIPYQTAAGTTAFIPIGADKFVLQSNGTTATWVSTASLGISGGGSSGVSSITAGTDTAITASSGAVTIWNTSTLQTITSRGATTDQAISITNSTAATSTSTGALKVTGGLGVGGNAYIGGNIVVKDTAIVGDASTTSVLTSAVTLDSFALATYRSAQYTVSISNAGLGEYQTSDVLLVHNGTNSFVQATSVYSGSKVIMNFSTTISGGNVLLQGTGSGTGANPNIVKIRKTYITV